VSALEPDQVFGEPVPLPDFQSTPLRFTVQFLMFTPLYATFVDPPASTRLGVAVIVSTGRRIWTVAVEGAEVPPGPVQVIEYTESTVGETERVPEEAAAP